MTNISYKNNKSNICLASHPISFNAVNLLICLLLFATFFLTESAIAQPVPITTDSRIKTLVYNPNEVYQLKFHYGYQSFIEFSDDEEIEMISIGESFAWRLTPTGKRLFVRPLEISAHTNMVIITNKREYQFDIKSAEYTGKADEELVYTVRFYYPDIGTTLPIPSQLSLPNVPFNVPTETFPNAPLSAQYPAIESYPPRAKTYQPSATMNEVNMNEAKLNFDYSFAGLSDNITPIKIYDDGNKTFFQFKNNNLIIPSISSVDIFGNETPLNYVIKDNYVMVTTIELQFTLRLADSLLCIFNKKLAVPPIPTRIY